MEFSGSTIRNLDPKGRLMLTPDFREVLAAFGSENKVVLNCIDGCVFAYPVPRWREIKAQLSSLLKSPDDNLRGFGRQMTGYAVEMELDSQGRINIPRTHMDYAQLERKVILLGQEARFEIWDPSRYADKQKQKFDIAAALTASGVAFSF